MDWRYVTLQTSTCPFYLHCYIFFQIPKLATLRNVTISYSHTYKQKDTKYTQQSQIKLGNIKNAQTEVSSAQKYEIHHC